MFFFQVTITQCYKNHTLKSQDRPMDFSVIENRKFINMLSDYTLQLTFQKLPLGKFYCNNKE